MGDTGISATHRAMLDYGFETFESVQLCLDADLYVPVVGGDTDRLCIIQQDAFYACLPRGESVSVSVETAPFVYAGTPAGTAVGRAVYTWNGLVLGASPLATDGFVPVKRISFWEKWF